jgi:hypothetical protein
MNSIFRSDTTSVTNIDHSSLVDASFQLNGTLNITNSTGTNTIISTSSVAVANIDSSNFTLTNTNDEGTAIINSMGGTITINNSTLTNNRNFYRSSKYAAVYNSGGNITVSNSNLITNITNSYNASSYSFGVYNNSGTFTIKSGTISVTGESKNSTGIHVESGTAIIGEAEASDSPNYGLETADVSLTNPEIKADGLNGSYGIQLKNTNCKVYFYDGKIMGKTYSMQQQPTGTEYLYETKDTTEDGYKVRTLEWMRQQP